MIDPHDIANAAVSLAQLRQASETAIACDNREYAAENIDCIDNARANLERLLALATPAEVREAREITNAPLN